MRGSTTLSISDFNAAASIIDEAGETLAELDDCRLTADETRMLGRIEQQLLELALTIRRRLDLTQA